MDDSKLTFALMLERQQESHERTSLRFCDNHYLGFLRVASFRSVASLIIGFEALSDILRAPQTTRQNQVSLVVVLAEDLVLKSHSSQLNDLLPRKFPFQSVKLLVDESNHVANLHIEQ